MKRIKVDIPAIKEYLRENGMTHDLLIQVLGVEDGAFQKKKKAAPQEVNSGGELYTLGLDVSPERVILRLYFQGTEICKAASKVKGTRELDLIQAISYAAHMMYKFTEQEVLNKEI